MRRSRVAKELQLLFGQKFSNICIVLLACCGAFLEEMGVREVFVQNEIFGPSVADDAVMMSKNYIQSSEAMRNLSEAVSRIRIDKFKEHRGKEIFEPLETLLMLKAL